MWVQIWRNSINDALYLLVNKKFSKVLANSGHMLSNFPEDACCRATGSPMERTLRREETASFHVLSEGQAYFKLSGILNVYKKNWRLCLYNLKDKASVVIEKKLRVEILELVTMILHYKIIRTVHRSNPEMKKEYDSPARTENAKRSIIKHNFPPLNKHYRLRWGSETITTECIQATQWAISKVLWIQDARYACSCSALLYCQNLASLCNFWIIVCLNWLSRDWGSMPNFSFILCFYEIDVRHLLQAQVQMELANQI